MDRIASLSASIALGLVVLAPTRAAAVAGEAFVHIADTQAGQYGTFVDSSLLPVGAVALLTHRVDDGLFSPINPHTVGLTVSFSFTSSVIFNENHASMPDGAKFNVFVPEAGPNAFNHIADPVSSSWTEIIHPLSGDPDSLVFATPVGDGEDPQALGVWYDESGWWAIFNEDESAMALGRAFNVLMVSRNAPDAFVHTAEPATIDGPITTLDHPLTNGRPDATLFVMQNWNPPGSDGVTNDQVVAVHYDSAVQRWTIFNTSEDPMPPGAAFNVLVVPEPASLAQGIAVAFALGACRRRGCSRRFHYGPV